MWLYIFYLLAGTLSGWLFKLLASVVELIIIFPLFGFKRENFENAFLRKPKRIITATIFKNVIIGLANAIMVYSVTVTFVVDNGGNYWLYLISGFLWSLFIISDGNNAFSGVFFWTSTVNYLLLWFHFGLISIIVVGVLTFFISIAYYYGRIEVLQEKYKDGTYLEESI